MTSPLAAPLMSSESILLVPAENNLLRELLSNIQLDAVSRLLLDEILAERSPTDGGLANAILQALTEG